MMLKTYRLVGRALGLADLHVAIHSFHHLLAHLLLPRHVLKYKRHLGV